MGRPSADLRKDANFFLNSSRLGECINKFGRNESAGVGTEDLWEIGGAYPFQSSAQAIEILSTAANDTAAGTGARTVVVEGLDADLLFQTETVILNGATAVDLVNTYRRIFRAYVATAGSGGVNEGAISVRVDGGGTILAIISIGLGQTLMALYTVPADQTAYVIGYYGDLAKGNPTGSQADIGLYVRPDISQADSPLQLKHFIGLSSDGTSHHVHQFPLPLKVIGGSDIMVKLIASDDADIPVSGGFSLYFLED